MSRFVLRSWCVGWVVGLLMVGLTASAAIDVGFDSEKSLGHFVAEKNVEQANWNVCIIPLPDNGVLHYDSFTVPEGVEVRFRKNLDNTGVWLVVGGDVIVDGELSVQGHRGNADTSYDGLYGVGGDSGPGGTAGGWSISSSTHGSGGHRGQTGFGPSGGLVDADGKGVNHWLEDGWIHLSGGGGAGSKGSGSVYGGSGGLLTVAAGGVIEVSGKLDAQGRDGSVAPDASGGSVRLIADTIRGSGTIDVRGGTDGVGDSAGVLKMEALFFEGFILNNVLPNGLMPFLTTPQIVLPYPEEARPRLEIVTVGESAPNINNNFGGGTTSSYGFYETNQEATGYFPPNILLQTTISYDVVVKGEYMPIGEPGLVVRINPIGGDPVEFTDGLLEGSFEESYATVAITIPANTRLGHIEAWFTGALPISNL